jgi:CRISPR/Cas system CMR-associated protein Cmr1 (group 7 of RAMP superfamily)
MRKTVLRMGNVSHKFIEKNKTHPVYSKTKHTLYIQKQNTPCVLKHPVYSKTKYTCIFKNKTHHVYSKTKHTL